MNNLKTKLGKRKIDEKNKTFLVQEIFSEVSKKYDLMNDIMSFGFHRLWKNKLIEIMNIQENEIIIDVGAGTGDLNKLMLKANKNVFIYSTDLNKEMLKINKKKFNYNLRKKIKFIHANAESLPFENNFFDKYVISFCIRNITYIDKALGEAHRVLKNGGEFYCLEFGMPSSTLLNKFYSVYKSKFIPFLGKKIANNKSAYKYLDESISEFYHQDILLKKINDSGFENSKYISLFNGIVNIHKGYKI